MIFKNKVKILLNDNSKFEKMERYVELIEQHNKNINLTGFSGDKLWEEGIYESLVSFEGVVFNDKSVLDIGAGAGFPSIPLAISNGLLDLTIIESQTKRITFLEEVNKELNLNVTFINKRAEEVNDVSFDFITARAVAPLFKLIEISNRLGKLNSKFYFIKGRNVDNEIKEARNIIKELDIDDLKVIEKNINDKKIKIVSFNKKKETPKKFPRLWSKIK